MQLVRLWSDVWDRRALPLSTSRQVERICGRYGAPWEWVPQQEVPPVVSQEEAGTNAVRSGTGARTCLEAAAVWMRFGGGAAEGGCRKAE